jgi:hypothetical protein
MHPSVEVLKAPLQRLTIGAPPTDLCRRIGNHLVFDAILRQRLFDALGPSQATSSRQLTPVLKPQMVSGRVS